MPITKEDVEKLETGLAQLGADATIENADQVLERAKALITTCFGSEAQDTKELRSFIPKAESKFKDRSGGLSRLLIPGLIPLMIPDLNKTFVVVGTDVGNYSFFGTALFMGDVLEGRYTFEVKPQGDHIFSISVVKKDALTGRGYARVKFWGIGDVKAESGEGDWV